MVALYAAIAVLLLANVITCARDRPFCNDEETKVKTRWIFEQGTTCRTKISEVTDFYNEEYRQECQWWQDLASLPDKISNAFIFECYSFPNGTTKYKARVCCPGAVTRQRCFTCVSAGWQYDTHRLKWHSERCNHFVARPEVCNTGEVCQTTLGFSGSKTVSKFCAPKASCMAKSNNNSVTCQNGESPSCTYCCESPFCNYETPMPKVITGNRCQTRPCNLGGVCIANLTDPRGYSCLCKPGTWGRTCSYVYPTCNDHDAYCLNGGTCFDQGTFGRRCRCADGFVGTKCEIKTSSVCGRGAQYFVFDQNWITSAARNCTQLNKQIGLQLTAPAYLRACVILMGGRFVEGVNGHVAKVESMATKYCDRGDKATWLTNSVCCPACMSAPCQNDGWCFTGKDGYVCKCRVGYEGRNCENKVAICYVSGDPHYRTFDGLSLHYQGVCRYNLASSQQHFPSLPYFRVLAKSERRSGNEHVSYTRYVDVEIFGHNVRLDKGKKVYVDGAVVLSDATYPGFEITNNGRFVRMLTNFSLVVESDGDWLTVVKAPPLFAGKMAGLCGNADGDPDNDWRTSNGTDMKGLPNKYSLIGNSWQVEDMEVSSCETNDTDPPNCTDAGNALVSDKRYCGLLEDANGIFEHCIRNAPEIVASSLQNCRFDVCASMTRSAACGNLETFSAQCSDRGYGQVDWRPLADCPLRCGPGMVYKFSAPACLPTCLKPNSPEECGLPRTESCVCADKASVVVDGECVPAKSCGCTDANGVHREIGDDWLNENCTKELKCVVCETCTRPVGEIISSSFVCQSGHKCSRRGVAHCEEEIVAQWREWSAWGDCTESCGKGTQTRTRMCTKQDGSPVDDSTCGGTSVEIRHCACEATFFAAVDCKKCNKTSNYIGYVADKCDCSHYYQCELVNGEWLATHMPCPPCQHWDPAKLTCVVSKDTTPCEVVTMAAVTEVRCNLRAVAGDATKYIAQAPGQDVVMVCPRGTVFSFSNCTCVWASFEGTTTQRTLTTTVVANIPDEITCVNFDDGWNGFGATNRVYVEANKVYREPAAFVKSAARFDGSGHLEIPRFSNSYATWRQFAVSFCYKRSSVGRNATQGLITNGNCFATPSISISSSQGVIAAELTTDSGTVTISGIRATDNVWHHVDLSYDGKHVYLCVDGTCHFMGNTQGAIAERHCPMIIGRLEPAGTGFTGLMDELCFYETALPGGVVKKLQDKYFPAPA